MQLMVDGSWNPLIQQMGGAAILLDGAGRWITGVSSSFGAGMAFTAELLALEMGLAHAWSLGYKYVLCNTDCLLVVEVLTTQRDITNFWDKDLISKIRLQLAQDWTVILEHILRTKNSAADYMARKAAREITPRQLWRHPSSDIVSALCKDSSR